MRFLAPEHYEVLGDAWASLDGWEEDYSVRATDYVTLMARRVLQATFNAPMKRVSLTISHISSGILAAAIPDMLCTTNATWIRGLPPRHAILASYSVIGGRFIADVWIRKDMAWGYVRVPREEGCISCCRFPEPWYSEVLTASGDPVFPSAEW